MGQQLAVKKAMVSGLEGIMFFLGMNGTSAAGNRQFRVQFVDSVKPVTQCL